jgi:hypothetical protein
MNADILLLIKACEAGLSINKPVKIIIKTKVKGEVSKLAGYCDSYIRKNKIVGHKVVIHLDTVATSGYSIHDVIAHELIHAATLEHGLFNENYHHDNTFQSLAIHLTEYLNNMGFQIGTLYDPAIDTD